MKSNVSAIYVVFVICDFNGLNYESRELEFCRKKYPSKLYTLFLAVAAVIS